MSWLGVGHGYASYTFQDEYSTIQVWRHIDVELFDCHACQKNISSIDSRYLF